MNNCATHIRALLKKKWPLLALFALMLLIPDTVFAGTGSTAEEAEQIMAQIAQTVMKVLNMLIWPLLLIIGDLMDSDWIVGPGMEERLLSIWVQIRNLVNIIFVLVMLIMALYNVTGMGKDGNLAIKTGLPKLIIGIVLVNFTYLGGKLVLDLSTIATTAVFALPEAIDTGSESFSFDKEKSDLKQNICYKDYTATGTTDSGQEKKYYYIADKDAPALTKTFCEANNEKYTGEFSDTTGDFFARLNANNIGLIMAVNMGALNSLSYVQDNVQEFGELLINQLFSIIMFIAFAVSYLVLGLVLLARIAVLWVVMAFSPLIVLFYVVPELKSAAGEMGGFSDKVMKHLMSPIMIGISLTVGFMMIDAMSDVAGFAESEMSNIALKDIANSELLITGLADLQKFMIALMSIVVLWLGVFGATNDTYVSGITGKIRSFTENAGQTILGATKFIPGIPVQAGDDKGNKEWLSFNQLASMPGKMFGAFSSTQDAETNAILLERFPRLMGGVHKGLAKLAENVDDMTGNSGNAKIKQQLLADSPGLGSNTTRRDAELYAQILKQMIQNSSSYTPQQKEDVMKEIDKQKSDGTQLLRIVEREKTRIGFDDSDIGKIKSGASVPDTDTTTSTNPPSKPRKPIDVAKLTTTITTATTGMTAVPIPAADMTAISAAIATTLTSTPEISKAALVTKIIDEAKKKTPPITLNSTQAGTIADAIIAEQQK